MAATSNSGGLLKGRWVVWGMALFFSILAGIGVLLIVGKAADRVPYYIANADMPARTPITPANVRQVDVNADALPPTALTYADIAGGDLFTRVPLAAGDILTSAVTTGYEPVNYNIPDDFVTASIAVPPENAVGGKVKQGDYVDIAAVGSSSNANGDVAKVIMQNILVLDVTVDPSTISSASSNRRSADGGPGPDSAETRGGIPELYTLAVTPEDFTRLALASNNEIFFALSARKPPKELRASTSSDELLNRDVGVKDGGLGTSTTTPEGDTVDPSAAPIPAQPGEQTIAPTTAPAPAPTDGTVPAPAPTTP